jgi:carnitine 3-dehydrogenase
LATAEQLMLHVDSKAGKSVAAPAEVLDRLQPIAQAHARLTEPEGTGRFVGQKR